MFVASEGNRLHLLRADTLQITHGWTLDGDQPGWHGASPDGPLALVSGPDAVTLLEADGGVRWALAHTPWSGARESGCAWFDARRRAFAIVPDPESEFCLVVHLDREDGRVIAGQGVRARPAGITPVPLGAWTGLSEGEGQDAARAWWIRVDEAGQLEVRDGGWSDEILTDGDQAATRILTTPHSGDGALTVRSFPDLHVLRRVPAPPGVAWAETACLAKDRIVAQLLGDTERTVAVDRDDGITPLGVEGDRIVGAADGTWLIARGNEIERWAFED